MDLSMSYAHQSLIDVAMDKKTISPSPSIPKLNKARMSELEKDLRTWRRSTFNNLTNAWFLQENWILSDKAINKIKSHALGISTIEDLQVVLNKLKSFHFPESGLYQFLPDLLTCIHQSIQNSSYMQRERSPTPTFQPVSTVPEPSVRLFPWLKTSTSMEAEMLVNKKMQRLEKYKNKQQQKSKKQNNQSVQCMFQYVNHLINKQVSLLSVKLQISRSRLLRP